MTLEEKRKAIANAQKRIDGLHYTPPIPYPYCCICFERLTEHNIVAQDDGLIDLCLECKSN